ncbi:hypothetical protein RBH26_06580 [Natronolimnohabitans sp. A-GB9]|uniref:hypothetical protein n=1 Tax=Natronolimnohabitans sp. A-GB9 TaxID=3069757 RepID=UPI0027B609B7|nr:hypothetical protein [Natronolimnohabitans sp. A-GB9]MDQ2050147.1 hypothetical protein [Natronolimnohabitans sp. A-GB9]
MTDIAARQWVATIAAIRSFLREPTNALLLVLFPPVIIVVYDLALDAFVGVPGIDAPAAVGELGGTMFAAAFLAGLVGVFQVAGATGPDRRLEVCGYRRWEVLLARILTIVLVGVVVALISFGTFLLLSDIEPASPGRAIAALVVGAVTYGLLGVIIGGLIGRELEGSLVLVFLVDLDAFLATGAIPVDTWIDDYLLLERPYTLFESAIFDGTLSTGDGIEAAVYAVVLLLLALAIIRLRGGSS